MKIILYIQTLTFSVLTFVLISLQSCSPNDMIRPKSPTAVFTLSTGILGEDLMTFETKMIFFESPDDSLKVGMPIKLEAVNKDADSYEWYIHRDITPTSTEPIYSTAFSLNGLGAAEWPQTIRARLVATWNEGSNSVAKDTVDRYITLYDPKTYLYGRPSYIDTVNGFDHEFHVPPFLGNYKGYLASAPDQEIIVHLDTAWFEVLPDNSPRPIKFYISGLPFLNGQCEQSRIELSGRSDRNFTTAGYTFLPGKYDYNDCGFPITHGSFDPYTNSVSIRFAYDNVQRPLVGYDWDEIWPHRTIDEFIGYRIW